MLNTKKITRKRRTSAKKREYTQAPVVVNPGYPCPHCRARYDHIVRDVKDTPGGRRWYMRCGTCGKNFPAIRDPEGNS